MDDRRENDAGCHDDDQAAVQGVEAREELAAERLDRRNGAHPTEDHGRIQESIYPRQILQKVITHHARQQGKKNKRGCYRETLGHSLGEVFPRQDGMIFGFESEEAAS